MEKQSKIISTINKVITKNNDLNALLLSFSTLAKGSVLQGMLRENADKHRFFSLQLVHDLKTYIPMANLDLNRTFTTGLKMGWEDIKASFGIEEDDDELLQHVAKEYKEITNLYNEAFQIVDENMSELKNRIEEHLTWHYTINDHLPDVED